MSDEINENVCKLYNTKSAKYFRSLILTQIRFKSPERIKMAEEDAVSTFPRLPTCLRFNFLEGATIV